MKNYEKPIQKYSDFECRKCKTCKEEYYLSDAEVTEELKAGGIMCMSCGAWIALPKVQGKKRDNEFNDSND